MRFLVDANLPRSILPVLSRFGHSAAHVNEVGLKGAPDEAIAARARETQAVILSRDLDFSDIRRYPPAEYPGIIVLRIADEASVADLVRVVDRFLGQAKVVAQLPGRLVILESHHFRVRPALEPGL